MKAKSFLVLNKGRYKNKIGLYPQTKGAKMSTKAFKSEKIDEIKSKIEKAQVAIITDYKGMTVEEITNLRRDIQKDGGDYMVTKNTLAKIAVKGTEYEALTEKLSGPVALAFGFEDPVAPAKAVKAFIEKAKKGEILGAVLDGKLLSVEETKALANLPSKEELFAKMLGSINSPASGIVGCVNGVMASLTRAITAVRDQKAA